MAKAQNWAVETQMKRKFDSEMDQNPKIFKLLFYDFVAVGTY
jgi:hypothetical protein